MVVKLKPCNYIQYKAIQSLGYSFAECQITLKKDMNFLPLLLNIYKSILCAFVKDANSLEKLLDSMTEGMFITDRIYLDPVFWWRV